MDVTKLKIPSTGPRLLMSVPEAAAALGVCRATVFALIASGAIASIKVGRRRLIPVATLWTWVQARTEQHRP